MDKSESVEKLCHVVHHPVLQHLITTLRKIDTPAAEFRRALRQISRLLAYEATREFKTSKVQVETPWEEAEGTAIDERLILVPILRAGMGMLDGMLDVLPFARVGHLGIYRDKFIQNTVEYYFRIPARPEGQTVFLIDPLLATGDTAVAAVDRLKDYEVGPIHFICVLAAPEGIRNLKAVHPKVQIHTLSIERELNKKGYIMPGLGDAGDRLYDTV